MRTLVASLIGAVLAVALLWAPTGAVAPAGDSVFGSRLYVDPTSDARRMADRLAAAGDAQRAALIEQIASQPTAVWLGDWDGPALLDSVIQGHLRAAAAQGATPVFVTYAIPDRDCGDYSAGGLAPDQYLDWNRRIAAALAGSRAVVLIEPDSLSMLPSAKCAGVANTRLPLLRSAVSILSAAGLSTYLDGGNARWLSPGLQASYLKAAGVAGARGFFTNVSNFDTTRAERDYAGKLSSRVGGPEPADHGVPDGQTRCSALGEAPRHERRHLQRRPSGRGVVRERGGGSGAGTGGRQRRQVSVSAGR
jgi:endoglucanase